MRLGVAGAGTMGAGIAALAAGAGLETCSTTRTRAALGRAPEGPRPVTALADLAACELVIEAAPEDLEIKQALFGQLAGIVGAECVLATNTSSLSVTALAAGVPGAQRVVGMHFFNPPAKMRLLEVVAGDDSSPAALATARQAGEAMGKHVIVAADGPGFIVNRCNRPFGLEALRIVQERLATPAEVDASCRAGGFRMGPFELMDLVGLDVSLAVSKSFYEQSFGEPRWRPSPLVARLVAAGRLGRKSGRGWYEYPQGPPAVSVKKLAADSARGRRPRSPPRTRCWSGSSSSSSTRPASRSARASARPTTSTRAWCSASTTRAARSNGATRSARTGCSPRSSACTPTTARSATARLPGCCAPCATVPRCGPILSAELP